MQICNAKVYEKIDMQIVWMDIHIQTRSWPIQYWVPNFRIYFLNTAVRVLLLFGRGRSGQCVRAMREGSQCIWIISSTSTTTVASRRCECTVNWPLRLLSCCWINCCLFPLPAGSQHSDLLWPCCDPERRGYCDRCWYHRRGGGDFHGCPVQHVRATPGPLLRH